MLIEGKTAIVTGSGGGIGRALALEFARCGANVVCCGRRAAKVEETVSMINEAARYGLAVPTDVTRKDQVQRLVEKTIQQFGSVDVLYNNAGSFQVIGGLWEVDPEAWWRDMTVNLLGAMLCCHAVLPHMMAKDEGIIINMDGGGSAGPLTGGSGYGCSKAAVLRLTDTLAAELVRADSSVLVFALGPGLVRTEMTELQVTTPAGLNWIPSTKECFENDQVRPPEDCARAAVELIRIACPALNGRVFNAGDDFEEIRQQADEIRNKDRLVLRLRS